MSILEELNFTKNEDLIYRNLLKYPGQTVFSISKSLNMSRSSVYQIIEQMYSKGYILLMNGEQVLYYAENPVTLINRLKDKYNKSAKLALEELENIKPFEDNSKYINIKGFDNSIAKAKEIIRASNKEVYINTDLDINIFDEDFKYLEEKNVKVYVFSFINLNYKRDNVFIYSGNKKIALNTRLMISSDLNNALIINRDCDSWVGTITNNALMNKIIAEHIHHDIYLIKLKKTMQANTFKNVLIKTLFEEESSK